MKLVRLFFYALALVIASAIALPVSAATLPSGMTAVPLATISNDRDTSISKINLILGSQSMVRGIYMQTKPSAHSQASPAQDAIYWIGGIESDHGVVLGQGQGVEAILLRGDIESKDGRGSLVISYLNNGIFGSYHECKVDLQRLAPRQWQLVNSYNNQPVSHIKVQTWALGISTLTNVCPTA